jgi:hypothetical protein
MPLLRKESCLILLGLYRLLAEVEPSSLFEKFNRCFDDLKSGIHLSLGLSINCPLLSFLIPHPLRRKGTSPALTTMI